MKYLLPKELGGGEVEKYRDGLNPDVWIVQVIGTDIRVTISREHLTPVAPPIPEEPPPGAYQIGEYTVKHMGKGYKDRPWILLNDEGHDYCTWSDIRDLVGPDAVVQRLVPEPAKVELPWAAIQRDGYGAYVSIAGDGSVFLQVNDSAEAVAPFLSRQEAGDLGRALLAAEGAE